VGGEEDSKSVPRRRGKGRTFLGRSEDLTTTIINPSHNNKQVNYEEKEKEGMYQYRKTGHPAHFTSTRKNVSSSQNQR